jgi:hypothetical protein
MRPEKETLALAKEIGWKVTEGEYGGHLEYVLTPPGKRGVTVRYDWGGQFVDAYDDKQAFRTHEDVIKHLRNQK